MNLILVVKRIRSQSKVQHLFIKFWLMKSSRNLKSKDSEGRRTEVSFVLTVENVSNKRTHIITISEGNHYINLNQLDQHEYNLDYFYYRHTGKNLYYCHMCEKVFVKAIQLQRHSLTHDNDNKSFECYLCSSKFDRIHGLRIHFTILHTTKTMRNLPCPKCSKAFSKQRDLDLHIKIVRINR